MAVPALRPFLAICAITGVLAGCTGKGNLGPEADFFSGRTQGRVYALDGQSFEVVPPIGAPGAAYWCTAAEFARRELGADWVQDIYVLKGRAPSTVTGRIDTVTFTLTEVPRAEEPGFFRQTYAFKPGDRFSVTSAQGLCQELAPVIFF